MSVWPTVKLGELLTRVKDEITIQDDKFYARLTIRTNGKGIIQRDRAPGHTIGTKKQFIARTGQLVLSKIDARNGAFGILPPDCDNAIITGNFWAFDVDISRLIPEFFDYLTKTGIFVEFCIRASEGTTNRLYLKEGQFLSERIPLPPLTEQRRIVARIEELAAQINEAKGLRKQAVEDCNIIMRKAFDQRLDDPHLPRLPLQSLLSEPLMNGLSVPASQLGSGICFAKVGVVNTGVFNPCEVKFVNIELAQNSPYWLRNGDILVSRGNSPEFVGRAAVYEDKPAKCAMPDLLIRVRIDRDKADTRFVSAFFHTTEARDYIAAQISGTSSTMPKISQSKLAALPIPVPPLPEQRRIVAELDALQAEIDALERFTN